MRPLSALCLTALLASTLSGCMADDPPTDEGSTSAPLEGEQFDGDYDQGEPAGSGPRQAHGRPQREDGPVESGMGTLPEDVGFFARKAVTITNDFGGADRGTVHVATDLGSIKVLPGADDGYRVEAILEGRGATEQDARDNLARLDISHSDAMRPDGLHLATVTEREPQAELAPGLTVDLASNAWADITVYLPAGPAYELGASVSSGDIAVTGLRGPSFVVDASSGAITLSGLNAGALLASASSGNLTLDGIQSRRMEIGVSSGRIAGRALHVGTLVADTSSGSIALAGAIDTLEADTGSGDIDVDAHGSESGTYDLTASSGNVRLRLLYGEGHAYRVTADASSGRVDVDLPNSRTTEDGEGHAEAESRDFGDARVQTIVDVETSSGDITVTA